MTYLSCNPTQWEAVKKALAEEQLIVTSNSGTIESHGVTVTYDYNGSSTLGYVVEKAPWLMKTVVQKQLDNELAKICS
jgi:hypothetical protein